jgi:hypothetical protein
LSFVLGLSGLTIGVFPPVRQEVLMKEVKTTPLRQRMMEDMHIRGALREDPARAHPMRQAFRGVSRTIAGYRHAG